MSQAEEKSLNLKALSLHAGTERPKYERLKSYILGELDAGRLKPGDALPSEQRLCDLLNIARNTVRQAIGDLVEAELVERVPGRGTFVREKSIDSTEGAPGQNVGTFALVTPETETAFYPSLLNGFEEVTSRIHHQAVFCNSRNSLDTQARIVMQLVDQRVSGVAMVPVGEPTPAYQITTLRKEGIPVVFCHRRPEGIRAPSLLFPFEEIGRAAGKSLIERGHRRLGAFMFSADTARKLPLEIGFRRAAKADGVELFEENVSRLPFSSNELGGHEQTIFEQLRRMCCRADRPTAIMTSFDNLAELLYLQLGRLGLRVPEDVSLVGFGDTVRKGAIGRNLTSVAIDEVNVGRQAAELLREMQGGGRPLDDDQEIPVAVEWVEGRTLGPPPEEVRPGRHPGGD